MIKINILSDNYSSADSPAFLTEHGYSVYIEFGEKKILIDTGASDNFLKNAERLGINISEIELAVLSHGHRDHTGGLKHLISQTHCPIYLSGNVFGKKFHSCRGDKGLRNIGTDLELLKKYSNRFRIVSENCWILPNIALVANKDFGYPRPYGNKFLTAEVDGKVFSDDFSHELHLCIVTEDGLEIFSPCSHGGFGNIVSACREFTGVENVIRYTGGLHIVESEFVASEVSEFLAVKSTLTPSTIINTSHCTCPEAMKLIEENCK